MMARDRVLPDSGEGGPYTEYVAPRRIGTSPLHRNPGRVDALAHAHQVTGSCQRADQVRRDPDEIPPAGRHNPLLTYRIRKITSSHSSIIGETHGNCDFLSVSEFFLTFYRFRSFLCPIC